MLLPANTREIIETSLALTATKALEGRQIEDGEFTFVLADEENKILQEKTNKANRIFFLMRLLIKKKEPIDIKFMKYKDMTLRLAMT